MPRHSSEAYLLSALITTSDALGAERRGIVAEMFAGYQAEYRWIQSYFRTYAECPSVATMKEKFPGFHYTETRDIRFSADEVREDFNRRQLAKSIRGAAEHLRHGDMDSALLEWGGFSPNRAGVDLADDLASDAFLEFYDAAYQVLPTPWDTLTSLTGGGMRIGDYWVMAMRLGQGKSWSAISMAKTAILGGHDTMIYSMEMPREQIHQRMHAALAAEVDVDVSFSELHSRAYPKHKYRELLGRIKEHVPGSFYVVDSSAGIISPATISAHADAAELHIVDYIGLMRSVDGTRAIEDWRVASAVSNQLKEVALGKKTRVFALSQINRDGDQGGWKPPQSKHLSQADAIGQDADGVITGKRYSDTVMTYLLDKNRSGPGSRYFWTRFDVETCSFGEISRNTADDIKDREAAED
jgi:hypothetical protein